MKNIKRILSLLLSLFLVMTLIPMGSVSVKAEGETTYVAQIGDNKYETLADALVAANSGATIKVLDGTWGAEAIGALTTQSQKDAVRVKSLTIEPAEGATVKFTSDVYIGYDDNHTANASITVRDFNFENASLQLVNYAQVTVNNCHFVGDGNANAALYIGDSCDKNHTTTDEYRTSQVTVTNCTVNGTASGAPGIRLRNTGNVTLTGNTVTNANHNGILFESNSALDNTPVKTISITENTITEWNAGNIKDGGRGMRLALGTLAEGSNITINNNRLTKDNVGLDAPDFVKITGAVNATANLSSNYWNNQTLETVQSNNNNAYYTSDTSTTTITSVINDPVETNVAKIGTTEYPTLADAIAAVPTDGTETTITMIGNEQVVAGVTIANSQNVVLELNGHTVSGNTDSTKTYALITNRGTLTIQDSTDTLSDGTGTGLLTTYISNPDTGDVPGYASNTITNNGALTVKSGKIVNNGSGYACYAIDNQTNGTLYSPVLNIEGGRMEQMNAYTYAVRMFCNSTTNLNTLNMSGGVVTGGYGLWLQTPNANANKAQLTISGGTIGARDGAALYIGGTKADNSNIQISISGATIDGTGVIIQSPLSGTYGSVEITSGRIYNVKCGTNVEKFITGGTYDVEPTAAYIADGYKAIYNGDGTWTVVKDYVAQIGTKGYDTLEAAFDAVTDGQTIEVLKDIELTSALDLSLAGKTVVLDLGGNTLTGRTNLRSGNLTIKNGSVVATGETQALNVYGSSDSSATNYSVLTIANNVDVTAGVYGVCLFGNAYNTNGYGAVINIAGTVTTTGDTKNGAVFVSGNLGQNIAEANNVINITGTVTSATDAAIALNGLATVNVKAGANITGATAIAVKRGTLNVEAGATVKATGAKNENPAAYGNGTEMTGAAVSVTNTYSQYGPLAVNITGGTFTSTNGSAVYKKNAEYANDATIAISGGTFSDEPNADFIDDGYAATQLADGYYLVGEAASKIEGSTDTTDDTHITPVIVTENAETTAILTPVDVSDTENLGKTTKISEAEISGFKDTFEDTTSEKIKEVKIITGLSATQEVDGNAAPQTVITNSEGKTIFEAKAFGGQLRYDKKMNGATPNPSCQPEASSEEKSAAINYVDLRLAFQFTLPEGVSIDDAQWGWRLFYDDTDDSKYVDVTGSNYMERSYDGTVRAQGTKTYTSNLVITNLRLDLRKNVNFKAVMTLTYVGTDGVKYTIVQSQETPLARSIEPIVDKLSNDGDLLPEADAYIDALKNIIG